MASPARLGRLARSLVGSEASVPALSGRGCADERAATLHGLWRALALFSCKRGRARTPPLQPSVPRGFAVLSRHKRRHCRAILPRARRLRGPLAFLNAAAEPPHRCEHAQALHTCCCLLFLGALPSKPTCPKPLQGAKRLRCGPLKR